MNLDWKTFDYRYGYEAYYAGETRVEWQEDDWKQGWDDAKQEAIANGDA